MEDVFTMFIDKLHQHPNSMFVFKGDALYLICPTQHPKQNPVSPNNQCSNCNHTKRKHRMENTYESNRGNTIVKLIGDWMDLNRNPSQNPELQTLPDSTQKINLQNSQKFCLSFFQPIILTWLNLKHLGHTSPRPGQLPASSGSLM